MTPGITKADMLELVKDAISNEEIDQRLGMTGRHAQRVYGTHVARPPDHGVIREMLVGVLRWWLSVAEGTARDQSRH